MMAIRSTIMGLQPCLPPFGRTREVFILFVTPVGRPDAPAGGRPGGRQAGPTQAGQARQAGPTQAGQARQEGPKPRD